MAGVVAPKGRSALAREEAWEGLVQRHWDPHAAVSYLSAAAINRETGLQARLMAKADAEEDLPAPLRDRGLFLLPVRNGEYAILRGSGFHRLEPPPAPIDVPVGPRHGLAVASHGHSEQQYLLQAEINGLFALFSGADYLCAASVGRKRSPQFQCRVGAVTLQVSGVQVETDGCYENEDTLLVVEAKTAVPASFHIRQLYYPYRLWAAAAPGKRVRPVFAAVEPDQRVFRFWEYAFFDPDRYDSISLVQAAAYRLIEADGLRTPPPDAAPARILQPRERAASSLIPQADDLQKVVVLVRLVSAGRHDTAALAEVMGFSSRQAAYYRQAAAALLLVEVRDGSWRLTPAGAALAAAAAPDRPALLARQVLRLPVMQEILAEAVAAPGGRLGKDQLVGLVMRMGGLSRSTAVRRAGTVRQWLRWLDAAVGLVRVAGAGVTLGTPVEELRLW